MPSKSSQGNYYKNRTKKYYEDLGYHVQLTEFTCGIPVGKGKIIFVKKDVLSADGIAMNGKDIIFWNSKRAEKDEYINQRKSECKIAFAQYPFPPNVRREAVIWVPRRNPQVFDVS